jgi:hypothetical protein
MIFISFVSPFSCLINYICQSNISNTTFPLVRDLDAPANDPPSFIDLNEACFDVDSNNALDSPNVNDDAIEHITNVVALEHDPEPQPVTNITDRNTMFHAVVASPSTSCRLKETCTIGSPATRTRNRCRQEDLDSRTLSQNLHIEKYKEDTDVNNSGARVQDSINQISSECKIPMEIEIPNFGKYPSVTEAVQTNEVMFVVGQTPIPNPEANETQIGAMSHENPNPIANEAQLGGMIANMRPNPEANETQIGAMLHENPNPIANEAQLGGMIANMRPNPEANETQIGAMSHESPNPIANEAQLGGMIANMRPNPEANETQIGAMSHENPNPIANEAQLGGMIANMRPNPEANETQIGAMSHENPNPIANEAQLGGMIANDPVAQEMSLFGGRGIPAFPHSKTAL